MNLLLILFSFFCWGPSIGSEAGVAAADRVLDRLFSNVEGKKDMRFFIPFPILAISLKFGATFIVKRGGLSNLGRIGFLVGGSFPLTYNFTIFKPFEIDKYKFSLGIVFIRGCKYLELTFYNVFEFKNAPISVSVSFTCSFDGQLGFSIKHVKTKKLESKDEFDLPEKNNNSNKKDTERIELLFLTEGFVSYDLLNIKYDSIKKEKIGDYELPAQVCYPIPYSSYGAFWYYLRPRNKYDILNKEEIVKILEASKYYSTDAIADIVLFIFNNAIGKKYGDGQSVVSKAHVIAGNTGTGKTHITNFVKLLCPYLGIEYLEVTGVYSVTDLEEFINNKGVKYGPNNPLIVSIVEADKNKKFIPHNLLGWGSLLWGHSLAQKAFSQENLICSVFGSFWEKNNLQQSLDLFDTKNDKGLLIMFSGVFPNTDQGFFASNGYDNFNKKYFEYILQKEFSNKQLFDQTAKAQVEGRIKFHTTPTLSKDDYTSIIKEKYSDAKDSDIDTGYFDFITKGGTFRRVIEWYKESCEKSK